MSVITQSDIDKLDRAIADGRGARTIVIAGRSVTFDSIDDMLRRRDFLVRQLGSTSSHRLAVTSKGT